MTYDESYFHDADAPWMPKLIDVEYFKEQDDDANKKAYFSKFGWNKLVHSTLIFGDDGEMTALGSGEPIAVTFGNDTDVEYEFVHGFGTYDLFYNIRTNATPSMFVSATVYALDEDTIKVTLANPPGDDALVILMTPVLASEGHDPYVEINKRWSILTDRFNQRYYNRMLGAETMERWQNRLQNRFDEVAPKYELAYELYDKYKQDILDDAIEGEKTTVKGYRSKLSGTDSNQASGSDTLGLSGSETVNGDHSEWDTPDSAINGTASYADRRSKDESTRSFTNREDETTYGRKDTMTYGKQDAVDLETVRILTGKSILDNINATVRDFQDIDTAFIAEFENLFLNVFWY